VAAHWLPGETWEGTQRPGCFLSTQKREMTRPSQVLAKQFDLSFSVYKLLAWNAAREPVSAAGQRRNS
jgi:hypothetical protein